jgi:dipeptidase E
MCGGSAGAICWFDGGHSDSMDPDTYFQKSMESSSSSTDWKYIRVSGLGLLPGLLCVHADRTQSNGVPRLDDFVAMLHRHPQERGVALDHFAALVIDQDAYSVLSIEEGSVVRVFPRSEPYVPTVAASTGTLSDLFVPPEGAPVEDARTPTARRENPCLRND